MWVRLGSRFFCGLYLPEYMPDAQQTQIMRDTKLLSTQNPEPEKRVTDICLAFTGERKMNSDPCKSVQHLNINQITNQHAF